MPLAQRNLASGCELCEFLKSHPIQPIFSCKTVLHPTTLLVRQSLCLPRTDLGLMCMYQITRPKDLLSLCLVSKHVSEISFPKLYHDIDLVDPPSYTDFRDEVVKLNHILTTISNSRGIKSVRILRIPWFNDKFCHPTSECPVFVPLHLTFFTLLSRMEDNSLLRLEHPRLNREILEYLCLHQKNTCNLTLIWFRYCFTLLSDMLPDLLGMSVSVTELDLEIFENLQLPSINWSRLLKLRVVIRRRTPANIDWINTFLSCGLTRLTHLIIHGLHHSSTPLAIRACPSLTHVSILFDIIFRDFVMKISNPTIKHIHVSSYHARPGLVICIIRQLKDLESLRVSAGMMNPRRSEALATSILAHKATLQILTLHNRNFTTSSNYAQFVHLARQCQNLSQLRLALGEETILENCKARSDPASTILAH